MTKTSLSATSYVLFIIILLGCRQVVRHMVLVHAFGGSNPSTPAMKFYREEKCTILCIFCFPDFTTSVI